MLQKEHPSFTKNKSKGLFDMNNIDKTAKYQENVKELFKELASEELYDAWGDTFDIEDVEKKRVVVVYHGSEKVKKFKKACKKILISCICSVLGAGRKIKIVKRKGYNALSKKTKKS